MRDLRSRRNAERWQKESEHLIELTRTQAARVEELEEEVIKMENQMEQKQLDWGAREVEMEAAEQVLKEDARDDGHKSVKSGGMMPDPDLPVSQQLQQSLASIRGLTTAVEEHKAKVAEGVRSVEELQRRLREAEAGISAKDRIINDLRLQVRCFNIFIR